VVSTDAAVGFLYMLQISAD